MKSRLFVSLQVVGENKAAVSRTLDGLLAGVQAGSNGAVRALHRPAVDITMTIDDEALAEEATGEGHGHP